ncbi:MAG: hypothetical protein AB1499_14030 [Nitrospirota bacterium]
MNSESKYINIKRSQTAVDLAVIALLAVGVFIISLYFDVLEEIVFLSSQYEHLELDEIITVIIFLAFAAVVFSWRRHVELKRAHKEILEKNEKLSKALEEIKVMESILPICTVCKKIRDDKGSWHTVENYITEHTDTMFSHGLCPHCAKELYPTYFSDKHGE